MQQGGERLAAGDSHIPMQLTPDPLTAHELQTPQQLRIALPDESKPEPKKDAKEEPAEANGELL